jgi:hypothetical protein
VKFFASGSQKTCSWNKVVRNFIRWFLTSLLAHFFLLFYHFYIYLHVYTLFVPPPLSPWQNRFCPFVLWFHWRENIRDTKQDISFLLVWGKDSYTERFLALLPYFCLLQPTLIHLCQTSSLLSDTLPIVASSSLRLFSSLIYSEHINHIQVLGFLSFPYSSCAHSPPSV